MKIQLTKDQTVKFLMCFVEDARRIVNERKREKQERSLQFPSECSSQTKKRKDKEGL